MHEEFQIEMIIWDYLDGQIAPPDRDRIAGLIATDPVWKRKHEEALSLHRSLASGLDLEHTSMRFSKNVMEAVSGTNVAPSARSYINKWIIRGIAAFFIILITWTGVVALQHADRTRSDWKFTRLGLDIPDLNGTPLAVFVFMNLIAGLLLLDSIIRNNRKKTLN